MRSSYSRRLAGLLVAAVMLAGCMHLDGRKVDDVRLYNAILQDDVEYVRALVEARTLALDQAIAVPGYMEGTPLLTVAARAASLGVMRYLISAGADVNARTPINETALMLASFFDGEAGERSAHSRTRHDEAVRMLLAAGAEIENYPYHYTPLSYAAYQGYDAAIRLLLSRGARVDADATGGATYINTPLMMAAIQGHTSTALQLLRGFRSIDPLLGIARGLIGEQRFRLRDSAFQRRFHEQGIEAGKVAIRRRPRNHRRFGHLLHARRRALLEQSCRRVQELLARAMALIGPPIAASRRHARPEGAVS